jgi:hypothetical protein
MNRPVHISVNGNPMMETYTTGTGQILTVHARERCRGPYCVIHNRIPGPMQNWPTHWRSGWGGFMEVLCPHGVGHPAPEETRDGGLGHGCDGCCSPDPWIEGEIVMRELESGDSGQ